MHIKIFNLDYVLTTNFLQDSQCTSLSQPQGPLPDSVFISSNQHVPRPTPLTTCTKAGKAAATKKRKAAGPSTSEGKRAPAKKTKQVKEVVANQP